MRTRHFLLLLAVLPLYASAQTIGINANGATPNSSAMLDIDVSAIAGQKKGLLIPRMTAVQMNAIATPATGLLVFNTTANTFFFFNGLAWVPIASGSGWGLAGNGGTNPTTNFIGTTDNAALIFRTNNQTAGRLDHINSNAFFGPLSGASFTTGIFNTLIGTQAGGNTSTGEGNTFVGGGAGFLNNSGTLNTAVGFQAVTGISQTNAPAIGANASAPVSNTVVIGSIAGVNSALTTVNVGIGTNNPVERLDVAGKTRTTEFQMTSGAGSGFLLTGDVNGNAIWANPTAALVSAGLWAETSVPTP